MEGKPSYLACLTFRESVTQVKEVPSMDMNIEHDDKDIFFVPKCLVLISRHKYYNILKVCMLLIRFAVMKKSCCDRNASNLQGIIKEISMVVILLF